MTQETKERIGAVLKTLSAREQEVIRLRFGFGGKAHTLKEVGVIFSRSSQTIRMIESAAIRKLQQPKRQAIVAGVVDSD